MIEPEEIQAIEELKAMSREELEKVPFDVVRWQCKVKLCKCFTRMRDYGVANNYFHKGGIKDAKGQIDHWINPNTNFFLCSKHWKHYKGKSVEDIPLKRSVNGGIIWGYDDTGKETVIY